MEWNGGVESLIENKRNDSTANANNSPSTDEELEDSAASDGESEEEIEIILQEGESSSSSDSSDEEDEVIIPSVSGISADVTGKVTNVKVFSESRLILRQRRWNQPPEKTIPTSTSSNFPLLPKRDLLSYTRRKAIQLQSGGDLSFTDINEPNSALRPFVPASFVPDVQFAQGWAIRPGNGHMYGEKYIDRYRSEIEECYNLGEADSKNKRSPAQMVEMLQNKYPSEFCLPAEHDVRAEIGRLQQMKKKKKSATAANDGNVLPSKEKELDDYTKFIHHCAIPTDPPTPPMKPAAVVVATLKQFPRKEHPNLPSDAQIKQKFQYAKTKYKK